MLSFATTNSAHVLWQEQLGTGLILPQNSDLVPSHFTKWSDEDRLVELWLDRGFQPFTRG